MLVNYLFAPRSTSCILYPICCHWKLHFPDSLAPCVGWEKKKSQGISSHLPLLILVSLVVAVSPPLFQLPPGSPSQILPSSPCQGFNSCQEAWLLDSVDPSLPIVLPTLRWWWLATVANFWLTILSSAWHLGSGIICATVSPNQIASGLEDLDWLLLFWLDRHYYSGLCCGWGTKIPYYPPLANDMRRWFS